jgi:vitamin B12 transporter
MKFPFPTATATLWLVCSPGAADTPKELPVTLVTATGIEQNLADSLSSVTVIDRQEIERRQAQSVQDVLRGVPGLAISNDGGLGKNSSVFLRGTNSDHVLVLIDGVRAGSATLGMTAFQDIPIDQIDHIEIVRGPRSSLYGSEAIGGVIQIFTRKGGKGLQPYLSAGVGSHSLYRASGGIAGGNERAWYSLNGARLETRGYDAQRGSEPDRDGYYNTSGSARVGYRFDNGLELDGNVLQAEGHNRFDGSFQNNSEVVQQMVGGRLKYAPLAFWQTRLQAGRTLDESGNFLNRNFISRFDSQRVNVTWQNDITVTEKHQVSVGLDYFNDQVGGTTDYLVKSRDNKAGFVQYQTDWQAMDLLLGARYDDNEQFGSHATGNAAVGYRFDNGIRLSGSWGNAFKAPGFNQLYFPGFGNPALSPETSESWEVSLNGRHAGITWAVNGYHTEVENLINTVCDLDWNCTAVNADQARILGLETRASTRILGFDLAANLTLTEPLNLTTGPNQGHALPRRPRSLFRFDMDRRLGPVQLGGSVYGESRRYDDLANTQSIPGFVTVDLRTRIDLTHGLALEGRIANLLDQDYRNSGRYYQDGRNFMLGLRYQP